MAPEAFLRLAKTLGALANPALILVVLMLASAVAILLRRYWLAALLYWAMVAIVVLFAVLPGGTWLALPLETRFPENPDLPDHVAGIIVLGGTERVTASLSWDQPLIADPTPIAALIALGRRFPDATLAFSGGGTDPRDTSVTESDVVHGFLDELGINGNQIIYERRSRDTYENAIRSRDLLLPKPDDRWILVTEAIAMPRAIGVFRHAGWNVIPYPAGYLTASRDPRLFSLSLGGLELAAVALHEWAGLLAYRFMGYTDELFPR
jgi:uncharacterized SAM-binding protein YcdF (DUF218 family)